MAKKFDRFIWQFVIGLGFLSGLWTASESILKGSLSPPLALPSHGLPGSHTPRTPPDPAHPASDRSVIGAYRNGKVPGLISVLVAYGAGLVILSSAIAGLVLLGVAVLLAYFSTRTRRR